MSRGDVTTELLEALWARDMGCVLSFLEPGHVCRNAFGEVIGWRDPYGISLEHVKSELRLGKRAPSDLAHTVLLCAGSNVGVPSKKQRAAMRVYLAQRRVA